jgi:hypothetical protein
MADDKVVIKVLGEDRASRVFHRIGRSVTGLGGRLRTLGSSLFNIKTAFAGIIGAAGAGLLTREFLKAARTTENLRTRLVALLGSVEEGNKLFQDLVDYAGKVPFEYQEIMESATMLSGILKGGREDILKWLPVIADLAAATGLGIQETTGQVMRMLSAGAASADLFRERGVLAMLGFTAGVRYSAEETERILYDAWSRQDSRFRGLTEDLAKNWDGMVSMIRDAWFQFRNTVMEAGLFDNLKAALKVALNWMDRMKETGRFKEWADDISSYVIQTARKTVLALATIADALAPVLEFVWGALKKAFEGYNELLDLIARWEERSQVTKARKGYQEAIAQQARYAQLMTTTTQNIIEMEKSLEAAKKHGREGMIALRQRELDIEKRRLEEYKRLYDEAAANLIDFGETYRGVIEQTTVGLPELDLTTWKGKVRAFLLEVDRISADLQKRAGRDRPQITPPAEGERFTPDPENEKWLARYYDPERFRAFREALRAQAQQDAEERLGIEVDLARELAQSDHLSAAEREAIWEHYKEVRRRQIKEEAEAMRLLGVDADLIVAAQKAALAELEPAHEAAVNKMTMVWDGFTENLAWSLESGFFDLFKDGIDDAGDAFEQFTDNLSQSFSRAISKMITEMILFGEVGGSAETGAGIMGFLKGLFKFQHGGWINELVYGVGASGRRYLIGERGPELVTPAAHLGGRTAPSVQVNVKNETGVPLDVGASATQIDMEGSVIDIVLRNIQGFGVLHQAVAGVR